MQPCRLGCSKQLPQCDQAKHEADECPYAVVNCAYFGCGATYRRSDKQRHDAESMADHLAGETRARIAYTNASCVKDRKRKETTAAFITFLQKSEAGHLANVLCALPPYLALAPEQLVADACTAVLTAMHAHGAHADLQVAGLTCLAFVAQRLQPNGAATAALAASAVSTLLAAMNAHPADALLQYLACNALTTPTAPQCGAANNTLFMPSLAAGSCTPALLAALQRHNGEPRLQATGLRALGSCAEPPGWDRSRRR